MGSSWGDKDSWADEVIGDRCAGQGATVRVLVGRWGMTGSEKQTQRERERGQGEREAEEEKEGGGADAAMTEAPIQAVIAGQNVTGLSQWSNLANPY